MTTPEQKRRWYLRNRERILVERRRYRLANLETIREYDRQRARTPAGRIRLNRVNAAWAKRNPEKRHAQTLLQSAIRWGKMKRQPCEKCGKKAEAHHADYSKPYEVRWLCKQHHEEIHHGTAA